MVWFKVDDHLHSHRKVKKSGLEAIGLWTVSGSYCAAYLTDGFVEAEFVSEWRRGPRLAAILVAAGLWYEAVKDGEKGWQFHDWDKHQPTKQQVEADRENWRKKKAQQRQARSESLGDSSGESTGVSRKSPVPTIPSRPSRPSRPLSLVTSSGGVTQVSDPDPEPPRFCSSHPNGAPGVCGPCKQSRIAHEDWDRREADRKQAVRDECRRRSQNCPLCQGTNVIEISDDEVRKCNHDADAANA